jgi:hypothetical protein
MLDLETRRDALKYSANWLSGLDVVPRVRVLSTTRLLVNSSDNVSLLI